MKVDCRTQVSPRCHEASYFPHLTLGIHAVGLANVKRWDWSRPGSRWSVNCKSDVACRTQRGQESPKERASPEVLLYSDGNSLSRGHKKEGTGFQGREHGQCKRGSCHLGHPACKYPVARWMVQV